MTVFLIGNAAKITPYCYSIFFQITDRFAHAEEPFMDISVELKNRPSAQHIPLPFHLAYLAEHFVNHSPDFDYHCTVLAFVHNRQDY